jgi:hypothetical protein
VPETLRQQISKEILAARIQARNRVLEKYPVFVGSKGLDETKIADRQKKRDSLEYELLRKAFSEILERYQLTPLQLTQIEKEAVSKGWISYPSPPPDYR